MTNRDFLLRVVRTWWWCLKCVIVYLVRDIPALVMYCVNGESGSSLLIESNDSMIAKFMGIERTKVYSHGALCVSKLVQTVIFINPTRYI